MATILCEPHGENVQNSRLTIPERRILPALLQWLTTPSPPSGRDTETEIRHTTHEGVMKQKGRVTRTRVFIAWLCSDVDKNREGRTRRFVGVRAQLHAWCCLKARCRYGHVTGIAGPNLERRRWGGVRLERQSANIRNNLLRQRCMTLTLCLL